jgi:hypothetical protein
VVEEGVKDLVTVGVTDVEIVVRVSVVLKAVIIVKVVWKNIPRAMAARVTVIWWRLYRLRHLGLRFHLRFRLLRNHHQLRLERSHLHQVSL